MGAKRFLFTNQGMCFVVAVMVLFSTATAFAEIRIVALGDSGIRGKGVPESQAYPAQLEAALRARGHQVTVTNQGVNGDTTTGVLARLDAEVYLLENMQQGIVDRGDLHVESSRPPPTSTSWHLTPVGYAIVVRRTLPAIEALVRKVEKRR